MKKGIIITSFGTTFEETRKLCIESIENKVMEEFKDFTVLRAFTSRVVISRLKKRDNIYINNPTEVLEIMKEEGIKEVFIQPLLIIQGIEYEKILKEARDFTEENKDIRITIGKPLLSSEADYEKVVKALKLDKKQSTVFMGHGSDHKTDSSYERLESQIRKDGYEDIFIGTVEGKKTIEDVLVQLKTKGIKEVLLKAFMLVAGDHARNDMASDDEDSWKSILEKNGIRVETRISGLGEVEEIQDIFIEHLRDIL